MSMASKSSPEIQVTFNYADTCEMQSGNSGYVIYFNVTNLVPQPTKIFVSPSSYTTKKGEEIDQDVFLNGLGEGGFSLSSGNFKKIACVYFKGSLARFSTGDKLRLTAWIDGGSISHEFLFECTDAPNKKFELLSSSLEARVGDEQGAISPPTPSKKEITNIVERLELLEEKFGIAISGLYASCKYEPYGPYHEIKINFDLISLSGGKLERSFWMLTSAYNSAGQLLETGKTHIDTDNFMGFSPVSITLYLDQMPEKIRLSPAV